MTFRFVALSVIACAAQFSIASPSTAAELFGSRGGWQLFNDDDGCGMTSDYEGPGDSTLTVIKYLDGHFGTMLSNFNWSAKEGDSFKVAYVVNNSTFSGSAIGATANGKSGFISRFGPDFESDFGKGNSLYVLKDDTLVDRLSLRGTGAALVALNSCLTKVRAKKFADDRERARWADLPQDPFSKREDTGRTSSLPSEPIPIGSQANWATDNDYPTSAMREGRQGTTSFRALIGADGRVTDCFVTVSSGSTDLDETTCSLVTRRAKFKPAVDRTGKFSLGAFASSVRWSIPEDPAPSAAQ